MQSQSLEATERDAASVDRPGVARVTLEDIKAAIKETYYETADVAVGAYRHPQLRTLTLCILVMRNGFTVIGKAAPADPERFDPALGQKFAYEDAVRQLWPLMGYALRSELHASAVG